MVRQIRKRPYHDGKKQEFYLITLRALDIKTRQLQTDLPTSSLLPRTTYGVCTKTKIQPNIRNFAQFIVIDLLIPLASVKKKNK